MKRRSIGAIGILAIASSFALAAGPAFADPEIAVEETYDFTSATHLSYTQHYRDSSKTLMTEYTCSYISSKNPDLSTKFHTEGSVNVCDVTTEVNETDIDELLEVSGNNFTFTSESDGFLKAMHKQFPNDKFDSIGKVTAKFSGGLVPSSADNGGTIDKSTGTVTWSNVKTAVKVKGSTDGKAAASSTAKSGSTSSASADSDSTSEASSTPESTASSSSSGSKWILLLVLAVVVIGGIGAFVVMSNRKKAQPQNGQYPVQPMGGQYPVQPMGGQYPQAPQPGQYPAPTGQPQPGQYPEQGQYPQATQYPQSPQQPGQYPQA